MSDPRKIATLGIGFGALAVASLGFLGQVVEPPVVEPVPQVQQSGASGLGSPSDGGRGYVYKDHQWVRLLPVRITRTRTNDPVVTVGATQRLPVAQSQSTAHNLTTASSASVTLKPSFATQNTNAPYVANSVHTSLTTARLTATTHATKDDYIEFDEILALLELTS